MQRLLERTQLLLARDLTLGTIAERVAGAHGDRLLVDEPGWRTLTAAEAADLVAPLVTGRVGRGHRVVVALPNSYAQLLACRPGGVPCRCRPGAGEPHMGRTHRRAGAVAEIEQCTRLLVDVIARWCS